MGQTGRTGQLGERGPLRTASTRGHRHLSAALPFGGAPHLHAHVLQHAAAFPGAAQEAAVQREQAALSPRICNVRHHGEIALASSSMSSQEPSKGPGLALPPAMCGKCGELAELELGAPALSWRPAAGAVSTRLRLPERFRLGKLSAAEMRLALHPSQRHAPPRGADLTEPRQLLGGCPQCSRSLPQLGRGLPILAPGGLGALAAVHSCMGGGRRPRFHGDDAYTRWPVALNCVGQYPSQGQSKRRVVTAGRRSATRGGAAQGAPLASRPRRRDERGPPPLRARAVASPRSVLGAGRRGGGAEGRPRPRVQPGLLTPRPRRPRRRPARLHRRPRWRGGPWSPCTPGHGKRRLAAPSPRSAPRPLRGSAA